MSARFPATFQQACYVLWWVYIRRVTQTEAGLRVGLNHGTVCHIVHGRRFPGAHPVPPPGH